MNSLEQELLNELTKEGIEYTVERRRKHLVISVRGTLIGVPGTFKGNRTAKNFMARARRAWER